MNSKARLLVVGAGGFGREMLWAAQDLPECGNDWEIGGFLDDAPDVAAKNLKEKGIDLPVVSSIQNYSPVDSDLLLMAIGSPKAKLSTGRMLVERGAKFLALRHPTASIAPGSKIGIGVVFWRHVIISVNTEIGDFCAFNCYSGIGHDAVLADGVTLSAHCEVAGGGILEEGVFMGSHSVILPGVNVGAYAKIGAGSVVLRRVAAGTTVMGVPARTVF